MKQVLSSLNVLIVLANSYYADNNFASDNTVYAKNRHTKNVCLSKGGNKERKNKGKVGSHGGNICHSKGGTSSGGVNKKVCGAKDSKSEGSIGNCGRDCNA